MTQCPECGSANVKSHNPRGQASKSNLGKKCKDCGHTFMSTGGRASHYPA